MQEARRQWPERITEYAPKRLIFLDETWFSTAMGRLFGYAPQGQRLVDALPDGHWKITNLSAHKTADVQTAFEACRINYLYLPPYSPDLNPIENAFSKLKRLVRSAAERTVDGLWTAIGRLLDRFGITECRNYFQHCGYHATKT